MTVAELNGEKYNPNSERFSEVIKEEVRKRQNGLSVITQEPISEFHHRCGKGRGCNSVENCVGVGPVAHALIHLWQWEVTGAGEEWDAYEGQRILFDAKSKELFRKLKDRSDLKAIWVGGYQDPVEMMIRGRPNVHYI